MITKAQTIDSIQSLNPTATHTWLGHFDLDSLQAYLAHLEHAACPRHLEATGWTRCTEASATTSR